MFESTEQAVAVLKDSSLPELERADAAHFLQDHPTAEAIDALVAALTDVDHGVRWAAGSALAHIGEPAMPALLWALAQPNTSKVLRDGAHHVVTDNSSPRVVNLCQPLLQALKGPQAGIASMEAAISLMPHFR